MGKQLDMWPVILEKAFLLREEGKDYEYIYNKLVKHTKNAPAYAAFKSRYLRYIKKIKKDVDHITGLVSQGNHVVEPLKIGVYKKDLSADFMNATSVVVGVQDEDDEIQDIKNKLSELERMENQLSELKSKLEEIQRDITVGEADISELKQELIRKVSEL